MTSEGLQNLRRRIYRKRVKNARETTTEVVRTVLGLGLVIGITYLILLGNV